MNDTKVNARKVGLVVFTIGLIMAAIFVGIPAYRLKTAAPRFMLWGGLFAASCILPFIGLVCMLGGDRVLKLVHLRDENNLSWQQAVYLIVIGIIGLTAYISFEALVRSLGYRLDSVF